MDSTINSRPGTDLTDTRAHTKDHQGWSRRSFLRTIGLGGATGFALSGLPLTGLYGFPLATATNNSGRKLVLIRLKGGNDGLNTFVPLYAYDRYRNVRPSLGYREADLINLNDDFAVPRAMSRLQPLWEAGKMRVINSVGYPEHNLSHFTGADIMASGNNNPAENGDGWLARYYTGQVPDYVDNPPATPPAIKIGGPTSILFNDENKVDISANFATAERLSEVAETGTVFRTDVAPDECYYGEQVTFLRTISNAAYRYSSVIFDAYNQGSNDVAYTSALGEQLQLVARLIKGGLDTQLYLVTLDGFDTHAGQNGFADHPGLLENLSTAVNEFYQDLAVGEHDQQVLSMTYSEFGRRVEENGVSGTDHGTALPVMLFGPALGGSGTHGKNPDLVDLDPAGNLKFGTDFRSIYATVLQRWFCIDGEEVDRILGDSYSRLDDIGLSCSTTSVLTPADRTQIETRVLPLGGGNYALEFELPTGADVRIELYTINGQRIRSLRQQFFHGGNHRVDFSLAGLNVELAPMVATLYASGQRVSKKFVASSH